MAGNFRDWLASLELEHLTQVFEENQVSAISRRVLGWEPTGDWAQFVAETPPDA